MNEEKNRARKRQRRLRKKVEKNLLKGLQWVFYGDIINLVRCMDSSTHENLCIWEDKGTADSDNMDEARGYRVAGG